jgi:hypothetical protein
MVLESNGHSVPEVYESNSYGLRYSLLPRLVDMIIASNTLNCRTVITLVLHSCYTYFTR